MNKEINKKLTDFELKMKDNFVERHAHELSNKTPTEIIEAYIKWRHNRYVVIDEDEIFAVVDMYKQDMPVAMICKKMDPDAYNHAWGIAEELNNLPEDFVSIGNEVFPFTSFEADFTPSTMYDETMGLHIKEPDVITPPFDTINDVIKGARKFLEDQEKDDDQD